MNDLKELMSKIKEVSEEKENVLVEKEKVESQAMSDTLQKWTVFKQDFEQFTNDLLHFPHVSECFTIDLRGEEPVFSEYSFADGTNSLEVITGHNFSFKYYFGTGFYSQDFNVKTLECNYKNEGYNNDIHKNIDTLCENFQTIKDIFLTAYTSPQEKCPMYYSKAYLYDKAKEIGSMLRDFLYEKYKGDENTVSTKYFKYYSDTARLHEETAPQTTNLNLVINYNSGESTLQASDSGIGFTGDGYKLKTQLAGILDSLETKVRELFTDYLQKSETELSSEKQQLKDLKLRNEKSSQERE